MPSYTSIWECSMGIPLEQLLQAIPLEQLLIQTVNGIVTGMILALVASGLTLIFGIMDVVNFAHGELFMLGAYVGVITLAATGNFWVALIVATLTIALLGAAIYVTTLRPLLGRDPLTTILATFGISLVLQNYALWQFGPVARRVQEPFTGQFTLFYLDYPWYRLVIAGLGDGGGERRTVRPARRRRSCDGGRLDPSGVHRRRRRGHGQSWRLDRRG